MKKLRLAFIFATLAISPFLCAQSQPPATPPEARQFDFWVGDWEVTTPDGQKAGENCIEKIAGERGLLENWSDAMGGSGKSLNAYNVAKKQWQQFWVGNGGILELAGGLNEHGEMVLSGETVRPNGRHTTQRITWSPNPDGSVRQHWEQSTDGGLTWATVFDGLYRRKQ